jgi:hypothetical protein
MTQWPIYYLKYRPKKKNWMMRYLDIDLRKVWPMYSLDISLSKRMAGGVINAVLR